MSTLKEFLAREKWAIYEVVPADRRFFGDTAFGPMWKPIPADVTIPEGMGTLRTYRAIEAWLRSESDTPST